MAEIQTADGSDGVNVPSEPAVTPKSKSGKGSGGSAPKPKLNERGVPLTNWDNPKNDPNARKHVGEDPQGKGNKLV